MLLNIGWLIVWHRLMLIETEVVVCAATGKTLVRSPPLLNPWSENIGGLDKWSNPDPLTKALHEIQNPIPNLITLTVSLHAQALVDIKGLMQPYIISQSLRFSDQGLTAVLHFGLKMKGDVPLKSWLLNFRSVSCWT